MAVTKVDAATTPCTSMSELTVVTNLSAATGIARNARKHPDSTP